VIVAPGDTPCFNNAQETGSVPLYICRTVRMIVPADGILTAEAIPADPRAPPAPLEMEGPGVEGSPSQTFALTRRIR
jgi:hypothetical protein